MHKTALKDALSYAKRIRNSGVWLPWILSQPIVLTNGNRRRLGKLFSSQLKSNHRTPYLAGIDIFRLCDLSKIKQNRQWVDIISRLIRSRRTSTEIYFRNKISFLYFIVQNTSVWRVKPEQERQCDIVVNWSLFIGYIRPFVNLSLAQRMEQTWFDCQKIRMLII